MSELRKFGVIFLIPLLGVAVAAQERSSEKEKGNKPAASRANAGQERKPPAAATTDPNYVIGAEDMLDISVWKEPDVSRTVPVRPDGKISLPLLNDIPVVGLTPMELQARISEGLKKFITNPQVTVIVTQINSRRIYILGEVARPGAFPMLPNMTVLQALSAAGGFTQFAKLSGIYVMRTENGKQTTYPFNYKEVIRAQKPEQNIFLKPGDTIVVP